MVPTSLPDRLRTVMVAPAMIAVLFAMTSELEVFPSSMKIGATNGIGSISVCVAGTLPLCVPIGPAGNHFVLVGVLAGCDC
jgi:hypothetical protein